MVFWIIVGVIIVALLPWVFLATKEQELKQEKLKVEIEELKQKTSASINHKRAPVEGLKTATVTRKGQKVTMRICGTLVTGYRSPKFGQPGYDYYYKNGSLIDDTLFVIDMVNVIIHDVVFGMSTEEFDTAVLDEAPSLDTKPSTEPVTGDTLGLPIAEPESAHERVTTPDLPYNHHKPKKGI